MKQTEIITDVNGFISGIQNEDEADFYTEICDYFDFRNLGQVFELNDFISTYKDCVECLKSNQKGYRQFGVLCKNIVENKKYNVVQMYNFYLLFHLFFDYLLFPNVKEDRDNYRDWIENQIYLLYDVAGIYYYDYDFPKFLKDIESQSLAEQVKRLTIRKSEYLLALVQNNIPENNFDVLCDKQIALLEHKIAFGENLASQTAKNEVQHIKETENNELSKPKVKLTMPTLSNISEYGGVKFAAERTGFSVSHIRRLARSGKIPRHKPTKTGNYRFFADELDDWKENGMKNFPEPSDDILLGKPRKKKSGNGKK